jgi:hypothetical protein
MGASRFSELINEKIPTMRYTNAILLLALAKLGSAVGVEGFGDFAGVGGALSEYNNAPKMWFCNSMSSLVGIFSTNAI